MNPPVEDCDTGGSDDASTKPGIPKPDAFKERAAKREQREAEAAAKKAKEEQKTKELLENIKADQEKSLYPSESDEDLALSLTDDEMWLYSVTKIKSADVQFSWPTSMLMGQILGLAEKAECLDDVKKAVAYFDGGRKGPNFGDRLEGHWEEFWRRGRHDWKTCKK